LLQYLRGVIDTIIEQADVETAVQRLGELLDESVVVDNAEAFKAKQFDVEYKIVQRGRAWDLSQVDVEQRRKLRRMQAQPQFQVASPARFVRVLPFH